MFTTSITKEAARPSGTSRAWAKKTLVVGPPQPVDGDSVSSTVALLNHLRKMGFEAYTLPTLAIYRQIDWIISRNDIHPACHTLMREDLTVKDLQEAYDAVIAQWRPDEIVVVDGQQPGFATRSVPMYIIDHHVLHGEMDNSEAYIKAAPSAGCLLIERFGIVDPILAVSILTDTFWFRQNNPAQAVRFMAVLTENGLTDDLLAFYQKRMMALKPTRVLTAMQQSQLTFALNGEAVLLVLNDSDPEIHRGAMGELVYFCKHICAVRADGYVSMRTTDERVDLRPLAARYGRGGHPQQAAAQVDVTDKAQLESLFSEFVAVVSCAQQTK